MSTAEYLAFVPLLLYGIGLADILGEWKRFFDPKAMFLPYTLFTIGLTEIAIYNVFVYVNVVSQLEHTSYLQYLSFLTAPFLFLITVSAFTPEKEAETKAYFVSRLRLFSVLLVLFITSHLLYAGEEFTSATLFRGVAIAVLVLLAVFRNMWLVYVFFVVWLVTLFMRINVSVG